LAQHAQYQRTANKSLKKILEGEEEKLGKQIQTARAGLEDLVSRGHVGAARPLINPVGKGHEEMVDPSLGAVTEPQFVEMTSWLLRADFELMEAQARLDAAKLPASQTSAERLRELETHLEALRRKRDNYKRYLTDVKIEVRSPNTDSIEVTLLT